MAFLEDFERDGTHHERYPTCPYCGYIHPDYTDFCDEGEYDCQECGKRFFVGIDTETYFSTDKLEGEHLRKLQEAVNRARHRREALEFYLEGGHMTVSQRNSPFKN